MLAPDLGAHAAGFHETDLKPGGRTAKSDKHVAAYASASDAKVHTGKEPNTSHLAALENFCYNFHMVSKVLQEVIERVETWAENRQDAAAQVLMEM